MRHVKKTMPLPHIEQAIDPYRAFPVFAGVPILFMILHCER
jgi:hypothetical protein